MTYLIGAVIGSVLGVAIAAIQIYFQNKKVIK